jgi:1-acyl-sn-glycerol-3-phosphate acyltransferase
MERRAIRWRRRAVTVPAVVLATVVVVATLPLSLLVAALADVATDRRLPRTRVVAMFAVYLLCETAGLVGALLNPLAAGYNRERLMRRDYALQSLWARTLFASARHVFGMRLVLEDWPQDAGRGPVIVLIRHTSLLDTLLPATLLSARNGTRLRYALKRELLRDPCLDVVGNRLPNRFTGRSTLESDEVAAVGGLAAGLGHLDGVLIYPEGTRFTAPKREQIIERLAESGRPELAERARDLHHVLPPRLGGTLALLEAAPDADVLVVAHHGFEGSALPRDLWRGLVIGQTLTATAWRVAAAEVPVTREARIDWLYEQWSRVDSWVESKTAGREQEWQAQAT